MNLNATLLHAAPQFATLAVLDTALATAEEVLLAHHPALHRERAPPDTALIPILIAHVDELRHLLRRYHLAVEAELLAQDDGYPF